MENTLIETEITHHQRNNQLPSIVVSSNEELNDSDMGRMAWKLNVTPKSNIRPLSAKSFGVTKSNLANSLFQGVLACRISKVKFLLKNGHVPVNVKNDKGYNLLMTALYISEVSRREQMFQFLLKMGVNCCYRNKKTGQDVLALASYLGCATEVQRTLEAGMGEIDIKQGDNQGLTPLHLAVQQGHLDVVKLLVKFHSKYRLSVDVVDDQGLTPYIYARRLGYNDIAQTLITEGHACIHMKDRSQFKSADEWALIGAKEQLKKQRQELNQQVAFYRIRGVLPPINELRELKDKSQLNPTEIEDDSSSIGLKSSSAPASSPDGSNSLSSDLGNSSQCDLRLLKSKSHEEKLNMITPRHQRVTSLLALNKEIKERSQRRVKTLSKSVDTAFTLLGLKAEDSGMHATHFVQSEVDTSKVNEYKSSGPSASNSMIDITDMMTALSEQQSLAFCPVARMKTPPLVLKPVKERKKVSTLAILMAKERRQKSFGARRQHGKTTMPMTGKAPTKTLADHAKAKKSNKA